MGPKKGANPKITKHGILEIFRGSDKPILTTGELIEQLPVTRQAANPRLRELIEENELGGRKASNTWFYWLPGRVVDDPSERVVGDELVVDLDERLQEDLEEFAEKNDVAPERAVIDVLDEKLNPPFPYWDEIRTFSFFFLWGIIFVGGLQNYLSTAVVEMAYVILGLFLVGFISVVVAAVFGPEIRQALGRGEG